MTLPTDEPAWIVDSPSNRAEIIKLWDMRQGQNDAGITAFMDYPKRAPEAVVIATLSDIEMHYGQEAQQPPYQSLRLIGAPPSARLLGALAMFGLTEVRVQDSGFEVCRPESESFAERRAAINGALAGVPVRSNGNPASAPS